MKLGQIVQVIRDHFDELPFRFTTKDTFRFFQQDKLFDVRGQANIALRRLEREQRLVFDGYGKNGVCKWRKVGPMPRPEWI
jgi:hypothetical protein